MYAQDNNSLPVWSHNLSPPHQLISQPILIHFWWELYQTDWYPKNQATVETATYGSEFVAVKNYGPEVHLEVYRCPHQFKVLYVW